MALKEVLLDTSVLIEHFRSTDKNRTVLFKLASDGWKLRVSSITQFEVLAGVTATQQRYWNEVLERMIVLSFDDRVARVAARLSVELRKQGTGIGVADLFIAATAIANDLPLATLNKKHFARVNDLRMVDP